VLLVFVSGVKKTSGFFHNFFFGFYGFYGLYGFMVLGFHKRKLKLNVRN